MNYRISELQLNLAEALNELERLREARSHQMQLVESIVRQRDMYRTLLAQMTGVTIPIQGKEGEGCIKCYLIERNVKNE